MALNPSIILAGQSPDIVNVLARSNAAAQERIGFDRQNAMNRMLQEQGAGIIAGDQNALNALAGYDPMAALGVQDSRLGMDATRLGMDQTRQQMAVLDENTKRAAEEYARGLSKEQAAAEAAELEANVRKAMLAPTPEAFDALVTQMGRPEFAGQFEDRNLLGMELLSVAEILKMQEGPDPMDALKLEEQRLKVEGMRTPAGPEWVAATPEQAAQYGATAGQINTKTGEFKRTQTEKGMMIESDGKGGFRMVQGDVAQEGKTKPSDPALMIASIDGILNDPALDYSTGMFAPLQYVPGTPMKRFQARAKQLEGQAFLQAFESLKGAGQITEIEGMKATQAIGRLDTAQSAEDYRQALIELRQVLELAAGRPEGWADSAAAQGAPEAPEAPKRLKFNPETGEIE
jgi:hypothetical protein